jgi:bifunctional UDP-N-acetylglucosamine pyrophosphorylase/glucosamine-1-phosphate N-acetyltransferase
MIEYVLDAARSANVDRIVAVVGHRADLVRSELSKHSDVEFALQEEQLGTGHAVMMCHEQLRSHHGPVLVLAGDTPLLRRESLEALLNMLKEEQAACVVGTAATEANSWTHHPRSSRSVREDRRRERRHRGREAHSRD